MISPTKIREDTRQLLALLELRESIAPSDLPIALNYYRPGDVEFLEMIDRRAALIRAEVGAKR